MATVSLTGSDTIILNNRVIADLADGNVAELTFPTEIASVKTGKNGNAIYSLNESGKQAEFKLRIVLGSADDKFLQSLMALQQNNFAEFPLMIGSFIKNVGDGAGNVTAAQYICSGGIFTKQIEGKSNVDGEVDQSIAIYTMKFSNAPRVLT